MEFLELQPRFLRRLLVRNLARVLEDVPPAQPQEVIQLGQPVAHIHGLPVERLHLGQFQIGHHDAVQGVEFLRREVVLGDDCLRLGVAQMRNCVPRWDFTR